MLSLTVLKSHFYKVCRCSSRVDHVRFRFPLRNLGTTFRDAPFGDVINDESILSEPIQRKYNLEYNSYQTSLLKGLKTAKMFNVGGEEESTVKGFDLNSNISVDNNAVTQTVYVRSFYDRLLKAMLSTPRSVLIGNPGVSKSWFQWYIIYHLANQVRDQADVKDECNEPIKVIVRQEGLDIYGVYLPKQEKVFQSAFPTPLIFLLKSLDPDTSLYLFEPGSSKIEPFYLGHQIRTIATCSPDAVRYKEFCKNGALKYYMPCWTLAELKAVGNHIVKGNHALKEFMSPQAIEERYKRFGGIMRCVIPSSERAFKSLKIAQDNAIKETKAVDIFAPYQNIEKRDDKKENISHFVLCYDVKYGGKYINETEFEDFSMKITSEYARVSLDAHMTEKDLLQCIERLQGILKYGGELQPLLFQLVVYHTIPGQTYKWEVFTNEKWVEHNWDISAKERVKGDKIRLECLKPGILYYPVEKNFPAVDFFFVKEREGKKKVFGIQVTFGKTHPKSRSVYEKFYERLGLDPDTDEVTIYVISSSSNAEGYAKGLPSYFYQNVSTTDPVPKLDFAAVKTTNDFEFKSNGLAI